MKKDIQLGNVLLHTEFVDCLVNDDLLDRLNLTPETGVTDLQDEIELKIVRMDVPGFELYSSYNAEEITTLSFDYFNSVSWKEWSSNVERDMLRRIYYTAFLNIFDSNIYRGFFNQVKDRKRCSLTVSFSPSYVKIIDYVAKRCLVIIYFMVIKNEIPCVDINSSVESVFIYVFRRFYSKILLHSFDGVVSHGASVAIDNNGYLLLGVSGSGKSTAVSFLRDYEILSDDTSIIRKRNDKYYLFHSPWWNSDFNITQKKRYKMAKEIELKKIFFLKKDTLTSIRMLEFNEAIKMSELRKDLFEESRSSVEYIFFLRRLFEKIETYELSFEKNDKFMRFLK